MGGWDFFHFDAVFINWEIRQKQPIVNLKVLRDCNFALGTALITLVG